MKTAREAFMASCQQAAVAADDLRTAEEMLSERMRSWYFSREELEKNTPSRRDGVDEGKESELRFLYCGFIREVGIRLRLPQMTVATAIMFCHRFYLHQSHVKNDWRTIATVCMFLASKAEDTPCALDSVVKIGYEMMYRRDPSAAQRIRQKDVFEKQKALILIGERLLLSTIRFDFNIQHPYRPLLDALEKLGINQKDVKQTAWNFVNDWLRTALCVQYKPHYIAAGSLFLAAKYHNVKLPSERGRAWWHHFDVAPQQLETVIHHMGEHLGLKRNTRVAHPVEKTIVKTPPAAEKQISSSPDSVLIRPDSSVPNSIDGSPCEEANEQMAMDSSDHNPTGHCNGGANTCAGSMSEPLCQPRDAKIARVVVPDATSRGNMVPVTAKSDRASHGLNGIDINRIKELMKKQKRLREVDQHTVTGNESSNDAWVERELETGIVLDSESAPKKQKTADGGS